MGRLSRIEGTVRHQVCWGSQGMADGDIPGVRDQGRIGAVGAGQGGATDRCKDLLARCRDATHVLGFSAQLNDLRASCTLGVNPGRLSSAGEAAVPAATCLVRCDRSMP